MKILKETSTTLDWGEVQMVKNIFNDAYVLITKNIDSNVFEGMIFIDEKNYYPNEKFKVKAWDKKAFKPVSLELKIDSKYL